MSYFLPIFVVIFTNLLRSKFGQVSKARAYLDAHHGCLSLSASLSTSFVITNITKVLAGRYRPFYASVHVLDPNVRETASQRDARMSFVSGHSSAIFCASVFIVLYLFGKGRILSDFTLKHRFFYSTLILSLPSVLALVVAISRTWDYKHNFSDINAGSIIGSMSAVYGYSLHYKNPWSSDLDVDEPPTMFRFDDDTVVVTSTAKKRTTKRGRSKGPTST